VPLKMFRKMLPINPAPPVIRILIVEVVAERAIEAFLVSITDSNSGPHSVVDMQQVLST